MRHRPLPHLFLASLWTFLPACITVDPGEEASLGNDTESTIDDPDESEVSNPSETDDTGPPEIGVLRADAVVADLYAVAGAGAVSTEIAITNAGGASLMGISVSIEGDPSLTIGSLPETLAPGDTGTLTVHYAGALNQSTARAEIVVTTSQETTSIAVFAATGATGIGTGSWANFSGGDGRNLGEGLTVSLPAAPFPHSSAGYTDSTVYLFIPDGFRDGETQDVVVHYHGWRATVTETLTTHKYREQFHASGANAILIVPQGPVNANSGNFGKLMAPGGLSALVQQALIVLYREGRITAPELGDLTLTSHSGGYQAVAAALGSAVDKGPITEVHLYDSLYAGESTYKAFVRAGGRLISNYCASGGTLDNNQATRSALDSEGYYVEDQPRFEYYRDADALFWYADSTHDETTNLYTAYGESIRWGAHGHRYGPRIELREAHVSGTTARVRWLSPPDDDLTGFSIQSLEDGIWSERVHTGPNAEEAIFDRVGAATIRVVPEVIGVANPLGSDIIRVDPEPRVLIVDGFDRLIGGSFTGLSHDFAAKVGDATGRPVAYATNEAVAEGDVALGDYAAVIWLLGDEGLMDRTFNANERAIVSAYLASGGKLIISGSEVAYELKTSSPSFLSTTGVSYASDDGGSNRVTGLGPLVGLGTLDFGGSSDAYREDYPDVFTANPGSTTLLKYSTGGVAAAGIEGKTAVLGFPLEVVSDDNDRATLVDALLDFVGA